MEKQFIEVYVENIVQLTSSIKKFKLAPVDATSLPRFSAGSHIITRVKGMEGFIERRYSLTNSPKEHSLYSIAIRKQQNSKGGSLFWHEHMKEGDRLKISFPKNHFPLSNQGKKHLFFAMGIGITPFLSMMETLKADAIPFELHYAAPSKEQCAFYKELNEDFPNECNFYFSSNGHRIKSNIMENQPIGTHVYFCGSEKMMNDFSEHAKLIGYTNRTIHYELFTPPSFGKTEPFQVHLARSKKIIEVKSNETLLDSLLKHQIQAPYSCKIGGCGSCQIEVLNGNVDHRDLFLTEAEKQQNNCILTCVSRAQDDLLVLNL